MKTITQEEAIMLHRKMWKHMKLMLGDKPDPCARLSFKWRWITEHGLKNKVKLICFLCEYVHQRSDTCKQCPINWGNDPKSTLTRYGCKGNKTDWENTPISVILELPEKGGEDA